MNFNYCAWIYLHFFSGGKMHLMCGIVQYALLSGAAIGYTITTSVSMV